MLLLTIEVEFNAEGRLPSLLHDELDNVREACAATDNTGGAH